MGPIVVLYGIGDSFFIRLLQMKGLQIITIATPYALAMFLNFNPPPSVIVLYGLGKTRAQQIQRTLGQKIGIPEIPVYRDEPDYIITAEMVNGVARRHAQPPLR